MFLEQLIGARNHFNLEEAEVLSLQIHKAEEEGYKLSRHEERQWERLTDQIMRAYNKEN